MTATRHQQAIARAMRFIDEHLDTPLPARALGHTVGSGLTFYPYGPRCAARPSVWA